MAVVYITEFAKLAREDFGGPTGVVQTPVEPALANQTVAIGASSVQSNALKSETRVVRIHTDAICHIDIGADPAANTTKRRLPANAIEYIGIPPNVQFKIAVITGT